ncbi:hypothetical protein SAMN02745157_0701 [Kaistia soli DSM 19436]|uniref:Phage tail tape measure protein, lambda family n=1 Tax=Kaistia soli DSM 19436 TaxID=1122133 RepID=A0A1M4VH44_9HYPH|nr:hypothetical protein [Kaistia soli]SHE68197.1 hypothetical protein SAMN02745157_0701 [Kaistia soli DSM 19436]
MVENIRFDITARDETTRAFRQIDANLNRTMAGFRKFEAGIIGFRGQLGGALAVTASATGLLYLEKRFVDMGSKVGDTADKIGITSDQLQELRYGAQLAGVETETLDGALLIFTRNLGNAELGLGKARGALKELGVEFEELKGQSPAEIFGKVADGLARIEDPMKRNALAAQLFGRSGAELGPLLSEGAKGLEAYADNARSLGLIVHEDIIRANQEAGDSFDTIGTAIDAAGMNISAGFLPAIREIEDIMTSSGFQSGLRDAAAGVSQFVQSAIEHYDELVAVVGVMGRLYLAFQGFKIGKAAGPVGMVAGAAAGYFAPEIAGALSTAGDGRAPLDANSNGKKVLSLDVTTPANQAEIDQYNAARDTLALGLRQNSAKRGDWSGEDFLTGGDGFTDGGFGGGGGGAGKGKSGGKTSRDRAADAVKRVTDNLQDQLKMLGMTGREQAIYNDLTRAGVTENDAAGQAIAALSGALYDQSAALEETQRAIDAARGISFEFASGLISDLRDGVSAAEALGNAFDRLADRLIDMALDETINSLFANLGGAARGGGGGGGGLLAGLIKLFGFADGGWTGGGGRGQVAGVVHGQEFVVNAAATSRNRALLEAINEGRPGFAAGGYGGGGSYAPAGGASGPIVFHQTINLEGATGDKQIRELVTRASMQAVEASTAIARKQAAAWVFEAQSSGDYRS